MKRAEFNDIIFAIETCMEREETLCKGYVALNPDDRKRRERDKELILFGLQDAIQEIRRRVSIGEIVVEN